MSFYECVFIVRQDVSGPQVEALADQFTKVIEDNGGSVPRRESWGLRSLAFRIRKNRKGHYVLLLVDAPAEAIHEVERQMRINEDVLRHMTVRVDQLLEGQSAMLQSRGAKDERPRREDRWRGERSRGFGDEGGRRSYGDDGRRSQSDDNQSDDDIVSRSVDDSSTATREARE